MHPRSIFSALGLALPALALSVLASGCSGMSVQGDEPDRPLPPSVERVVVLPEEAWVKEDADSLRFLQQVVAQLRIRSAVRDYGVAFVLADAKTLEAAKLAPGRDAVWTVTRCDFQPRSSTRRASPGAEAAPELEDEARAAAGRLDVSGVDAGRPATTTRSFTFSLRGWIRTPSEGKGTAGERPMRVVSRVALSGDCDFDEAVGHDDEAIWFRDTLAKIADSILDHLPRRVPAPGEVEEEDDVPSHGGLVPGERMPGEPVPDEKVHGELTPDAPMPDAPDGPIHGELK